MQTTIDQAGRVVVPKSFRERLGLRPGQVILLEETHMGLLLTPVVGEPQITETPNGPVIVPRSEDQDGPPLTDEVVRGLLEAGRR